MNERIEEIQKRFLNEPLYGPNGENYASDYGYLLNKVYRQQEIVEELERENKELQREANTAIEYRRAEDW
jgi:hypothetical protein